MPSDQGLKHKPFSSLLRATAPAVTAQAVEPVPAAAADVRPLSSRVVVRRERDAALCAEVTRVIGVPPDHHVPLGVRWRERLGCAVLVEGRDLVVMTDDSASVAAVLRDAGASELKIVARDAPPDLSQAGEPGGTRRATIRRGLRVAIVQKADQETGALTEGVVRDILTPSPQHPRGIKVRLESGEVGRVRRILSR